MKGRSAAKLAFMAAPFGDLKRTSRMRLSGDFLPKYDCK